MAGIERTCEFSGEQCDGGMYSWKLDFIQVKPEFVREFKGKRCLMFFFENPELVNYVGDRPRPFLWISRWAVPRFWTRFYWSWRKWGMWFEVPSRSWDYCVYCPAVPGKVDGWYFNHTLNPMRTLKKLERVFDVDMEGIPGTLRDWLDRAEENGTEIGDELLKWIGCDEDVPNDMLMDWLLDA